MSYSQISSFFAQCARFLQPDQILSGSSAQTMYGKNSIDQPRIIGGAILAQSEEEVIQIVTLANQYNITLYPISTGHNWGYGGATPHTDNAVILDLQRMRRILNVDGDLGIVTVEPGVTIGQLYDYLEQHRLNYMVPVTGAGPHNSLIGNALERGFGIVPTVDHYQAVMSLQAVLPDGRLYQSALMSDATQIHTLYKWGVGPYLDGLLTQGSYGIITQAAIALAPRPEAVTIFRFGSKDTSPEALVGFVRDMAKQYGDSLSAITLMSRHRFLLSNVHASPREQNCQWHVIGGIYGDSATVRNIKRAMHRRGRGLFQNKSFYSLSLLLPLLSCYEKLPAFLHPKRLTAKLSYARSFCEFMLGKPTEMFLNAIAYNGKGTPPFNPDLDDRGIIWYTPLIPIKSEQVQRFMDFVKPILERFGFVFSISLVNFGWRCFDGTMPLVYDRLNPEDCARAKRCYETLFQEGKKLGFIPYRVGLQGMPLLVDKTQTFWQVTRDIKKALDPNNILSVGRYTPES